MACSPFLPRDRAGSQKPVKSTLNEGKGKLQPNVLRLAANHSILGLSRRETEGCLNDDPDGYAEECQNGKRNGDSPPCANRRFLYLK